MDEYVQFLLLGLASGGVYAALAIALVTTFRSSGVLNLATGSLALLSAYVYVYLREGRLIVPLPGMPPTVDLGSPWGLWPAMAAATTISAFLGLVLYLLVFRPLRRATPVARTVASIGVMLALTSLLATKFGTTSLLVDPILPQGSWQLTDDISVGMDRVWLVVVILAVASLLVAMQRFTRFGLLTRACADSERGAYVSGVSPDRVAAVNWMISGAVAGLSGILIAPVVPVIPVSYTLFIVPALAAALVARFQYVMLAALTAVAIGMLQSLTAYLAVVHTWLPSSGLSDLVPLVIILGALLLRGGGLAQRSSTPLKSLGRAPMPAGPAWAPVPIVLAAVVATVATDGVWRAGLLTSFILAIVMLSLVVVTGYTGQISLAQLSIAGVAGFLLGPIATNWHVPFPLAPLLAASAAGVVGVLVGVAALRTRGLASAVVTLSLAVVVQAGWFQNADLVPGGGVPIEPARLLGLDLSVGAGAAYPRLSFSLFALAVLVVVALAVAALRRSSLGSQMLAVRANERAASASGVNVVRTKIAAFAIASFIAGIGGALYAYQLTNVSYDSFDVLTGLTLFAIAYLAGITSVSGALLGGLLATGGLVFVALDAWFELGGWFGVAVGVSLVLTVVLNPDGLAGPPHAWIARRRGAARAENGALTAPDVLEPDMTTVDRPAPGSGDSSDGVPDLVPDLVIAGLTVAYGGVRAVDDVSLTVPRGAIVGLIGPNGAGKTSFIDAVTGLTPSRGSVYLQTADLSGLAVHRRIGAGLGRTFQAVELYDDLSVLENVRVGGASTSPGPRWSRRKRAGAVRARKLLSDVGLVAHADRAAGELSQGEKQLVSIARALMSEPRVLLLDEPAAGLDSTESRWLGARLEQVRQRGVSILLVDHDIDLVFDISDSVVVMNFGGVLMSGTPDAVRNSRAVVEAYLGTGPVDRPGGRDRTPVAPAGAGAPEAAR